MKVELIDFTGKGRIDEMYHAAELLIFTKGTRLSMDSIEEEMSILKIKEEIAYMASTIPSSWEFVNVTFLIKGVTRATAQQITRTRNASYAMQSQRAVDVSEMGVFNPVDPRDDDGWGHAYFEEQAEAAKACYKKLIDGGVKKEDARGILPMNSTCNLLAQYNLRAFVDLVSSRKSLRTQGEYREIVLEMERLVKEAWPWSAPFFVNKLDAAIELMEDAAREVGLDVGSGAGWKIAKAADLIRRAK